MRGGPGCRRPAAGPRSERRAEQHADAVGEAAGGQPGDRGGVATQRPRCCRRRRRRPPSSCGSGGRPPSTARPPPAGRISRAGISAATSGSKMRSSTSKTTGTPRPAPIAIELEHLDRRRHPVDDDRVGPRRQRGHVGVAVVAHVAVARRAGPAPPPAAGPGSAGAPPRCRTTNSTRRTVRCGSTGRGGAAAGALGRASSARTGPLQPVDLVVERRTATAAGSPPAGGPAGRVVDQAAEGRGQRLGVAGRHDQAVAPVRRRPPPGRGCRCRPRGRPG